MTTLASGWLLDVAVMHPFFQPDNSSSGYQLVAVPMAYFLLLAGEVEVLLALLVADLLGGVAAGGLSPSTPGADGAATAALGALAGISPTCWPCPRSPPSLPWFRS